MFKYDGENYILELKFSQDEFCAFYRLHNFFDRRIEAKEKISSAVIEKYCALMKKIIERPQLEHYENIMKVKENTLSLINRYDQHFSFQTKIRMETFIIPPDNSFPNGISFPASVITSTINSDDIISRFFETILSSDIDIGQLTTKDKDNLIKMIVDNFKPQLKHKATRKRDYPTTNKLHIIAGCILVSFGLLLTEKDYKSTQSSSIYYTEYLAKSTKHLFQKHYNSLNDKT
ncbi:MAG: hypothetical protein JST70_00770 [Bacteroidetes bacterium]|nr:hypothetical protein [Bacteroidota bacterium]